MRKETMSRKRKVTAKLSGWLHRVGRNAISNWLLIVVFSCLAAYLVFPSMLDPLSHALFPTEIGPHENTAQVSFTVSGTVTYPGIVNLNITVTNTDTIVHEYVILACIGNNADGVWFGPTWYRDNLAVCQDAQNVPPDPWWSQAFICTEPLSPGESFEVTRKIEIPNDARIKDVLVDVRDKNDASDVLAQSVKLTVINTVAQVSFTVSGTVTYPGIVNLNITVTNTDTIVHEYVILACIGNNADGVWFGPTWYRDNLTACTDAQNIPNSWYGQAFVCTGPLNPGESSQVTRRIEIPNDPRITDALVDVRNKYDASEILALDIKTNILNPGG